ncbi:glycosyltransferase [Pseudomonas sp. RIT-PI-AD]|uniref:glycosyltransferase n=1 Tax=Pseudomonas sp. RIT-PI-AD TaxID=3035294 RepID=UPI0021DB54F6|nr:glycosyltransferase [Pseudomonas sp. RIT-PI-AD]
MPTTERPLVSLVTPTYNQAQYLRHTLQSVLDQDYPNVEYIVINDGSTDDTEALLMSYGEAIRWRTQSNRGQSATLNAGWDMARGKYLGYLSSDDLLYPSAISRLVALLEAEPTCVCAYPDSDLIDQHGQVIKRSVCRPFDLSELVVRQECYIGPGALFRADAYRRVGGWKPQLKLAPDREFWMRLAHEGRIEYLDEVLAGYRLHREAISYRSVSEAVSREYLAVLDDYFAHDPAPELLARRDEAYGFAHFILARNALRDGKLRRGMTLYREAQRLHPPLSHPRYVLQLTRNTVSKPIRAALSGLRKAIGHAR